MRLCALSSIGLLNAFLNLVIGHVFVTTPYVVRTVSASLVTVDPGLEEAAQNLGASRFVAFWRFTRAPDHAGIGRRRIVRFRDLLDNYAILMWLFDAAHVPLPMMMVFLISRMFDP